jgi:hypothetical protein
MSRADIVNHANSGMETDNVADVVDLASLRRRRCSCTRQRPSCSRLTMEQQAITTNRTSAIIWATTSISLSLSSLSLCICYEMGLRSGGYVGLGTNGVMEVRQVKVTVVEPVSLHTRRDRPFPYIWHLERLAVTSPVP